MRVTIFHNPSQRKVEGLIYLLLDESRDDPTIWGSTVDDRAEKGPVMTSTK